VPYIDTSREPRPGPGKNARHFRAGVQVNLLDNHMIPNEKGLAKTVKPFFLNLKSKTQTPAIFI